MKIHGWSLVVLLLSALPAAAQLEAINDLKVTGSGNQVSLTWTVPNDLPPMAGAVFPPVYYEVRYSTAGAVNESNWYLATTLTAPDPFRTGAPLPYETEILELPALDTNPALVYHFSVRWLSGSWYTFSPPSNDATFSFDFDAPAAITTLEAVSVLPGKVTLRWTATGDDGLSGCAGSYDLRHLVGVSLPVPSDAWLSAQPLLNLPDPATAGTVQTVEVDVAREGGQVTFALSVADERSNWSARSNEITVLVPAPPATGHRGGEEPGPCAGSAAGASVLLVGVIMAMAACRRNS